MRITNVVGGGRMRLTIVLATPCREVAMRSRDGDASANPNQSAHAWFPNVGQRMTMRGRC